MTVNHAWKERAIINLQSDFAVRLHMTRLWMDYSQTELGDLIGVSKTTISAWERNERFPTTGQAKEIANKLRVPFMWLLGWGPTFSWEIPQKQSEDIV